MNERPKDDDRSAKMVPGPWRWGWWKYHATTREVELRPLDEIEEINPRTGIFESDVSVVLTHRDYGERFSVPPLGKSDDRLPDWDRTVDGKLDWDHPYEVLSAMFSTNSRHVVTSTVLATKPVRALIAAAPDLLAACEASLVDIKAAIASGEVVSPTLKHQLEAAIRQGKETDR